MLRKKKPYKYGDIAFPTFTNKLLVRVKKKIYIINLDIDTHIFIDQSINILSINSWNFICLKWLKAWAN